MNLFSSNGCELFELFDRKILGLLVVLWDSLCLQSFTVVSRQ